MSQRLADTIFMFFCPLWTQHTDWLKPGVHFSPLPPEWCKQMSELRLCGEQVCNWVAEMSRAALTQVGVSVASAFLRWLQVSGKPLGRSHLITLLICMAQQTVNETVLLASTPSMLQLVSICSGENGEPWLAYMAHVRFISVLMFEPWKFFVNLCLVHDSNKTCLYCIWQ